MLEKFLLKAISSSHCSWTGHVVQTSNNIRRTCKSFDLMVKFLAQQYLPVVYVSRVDLLPKPIEGWTTVNMQRIINRFGSFSGTVMALKTVLWFLFYHHLQLMTIPSKIHFLLLKKLLILIVIFL